MNEIRCIVETGIYVDDLDRTEQFYRDALGLPVVIREDGRHVFFRVGSGMLLAFLPEGTKSDDKLPAHGCYGPGHFSLGIDSDAIDYWRDRLLGLGIEIEREIDWPTGTKSLYFRDPAGNSVELMTPGLWGLDNGF